ncbi:MAG: RlmE family RNA methyltransferase [Deltaproteobacteria bacterium]|mgnify:CR=1 FL=1|jgi:23S rRNA (uridine2552-2'-O)-methyltransferase|nr:RlmE family RNA methyltransferase [Deltaproteobacteria bacterium]MBT4268164.1 RlmE family RNA methyltransferase [Deltaproteobacteria bacterium]MBT4640207.1 RlmE family RNA methyltransferase [Deltaproteobacteria bacterium]MBT6612037.1 RlmE family RNA methyltransferase [Deltaproteobacteria bacterium]MBT7151838.1 RlmE family RNA methyltransferase [Deltaproteobacteria bacterium]
MKTVQDHYFNKAKKEGFAARSAYKLQEIDQKHQLLKNGSQVLDLGCYPGSWMQYISKKIGSNGRVVGIDRTELRIALKENMRFIHSDIDDVDPDDPGLFAGFFDVICSDMAPNSTGIKNVDSERSFHLCQMALDIASHKLKKTGSVLLKSFHGSTFDRLVKLMRTDYQQVKIIKPKSSRDESKEVFILGNQKR